MGNKVRTALVLGLLVLVIFVLGVSTGYHLGYETGYTQGSSSIKPVEYVYVYIDCKPVGPKGFGEVGIKTSLASH